MTVTENSNATKTIDRITRRDGVAGQYAYDVTVTYHFPDAEPQTTEVFFTSSAYGAPVIMGDRNGQHFVEEWRRFGEELNPSWIRNFFS